MLHKLDQQSPYQNIKKVKTKHLAFKAKAVGQNPDH